MTPPHRRNGGRRAAFTLIEMLVVIVVILILAGLTVAVVGRTIDGDRVRGGARQVQNYLSGARDRAIYAYSRLEDPDALPPAIGVRFIPDASMSVFNTTTGRFDRLVYSSMVFVQEVDPLPTRLSVYQEEVAPAGSGIYIWRASQFAPNNSGGIESFGASGGEFGLRAAGSLIVRGLIPSRRKGGSPTIYYYLPVYFDRDSSREPYFVEFTLADLRKDGDPNPPANVSALASGTWWLLEGTLSKSYFDAASDAYTPQTCRFRVMPSVLPSEEPRLLPQGCVVDGNSSSVGGTPGSLMDSVRADGSFDVMFNSRGIVDGPMAAVGQIHLVLADSEDVERGFRISGPFVNPDGTPYLDATGASPAGGEDVNGNGVVEVDVEGEPAERQGEEFIVSVRTQTGSIYTSDVNPVSDGSLSPPDLNGPFLRDDPFRYADGGGEAR